KPEEVGRRGRALDADLVQSRADLLLDGIGGVGLRDTEVGPEDVHHGDVGDRASVRVAPAFQVGHPAFGLGEKPLAEFVEQARLPDAGFAEDAYDLAVAA